MKKKHCTDRFSGHLPDSIRSVVRTASGRLDCIRVRSGEPGMFWVFFSVSARSVSWFITRGSAPMKKNIAPIDFPDTFRTPSGRWSGLHPVDWTASGFDPVNQESSNIFLRHSAVRESSRSMVSSFLFFSRSVFPSLHRARSLRTLSVAVTGMERDRVITGREPTTIGFRRAELRAPAGHSCRNRRSRSRDARRSIPAPTFWIASRLFHSELRRSRHPSPENPLLTPRVSPASSPLAPIFAGRLPASLWV